MMYQKLNILEKQFNIYYLFLSHLLLYFCSSMFNFRTMISDKRGERNCHEKRLILFSCIDSAAAFAIQGRTLSYWNKG